ncbi:MAG: amino acid adenylation domain-containing protein, partial [bacterium]|nr:amino acid adenylation domain-containing protein [bacterium]
MTKIKKIKKVAKKDIDNILALTPMQEGMLYQFLKAPEADYYFEQLSLRVRGKIEPEQIKQAWQHVVDTNEILRTKFRWEKVKKPIQIIMKKKPIELLNFDLSTLADKDKKKFLDDVKEKDIKRKFDLLEVPFRVSICKISDDTAEMIISSHHILYDGWSTGIILKEFFNACNQLEKGEKLTLTNKTKFKEFVKWYKNQDALQWEKYWKTYLEGVQEQTELPVKVTKQRKIGAKGETYGTTFPLDMKEELEEYARKTKITLTTLLYGAWGILIHKYTGSSDVVFGTTVSGRNADVKGIEDIVGLFINTVPLRVKTNNDDTIRTLMERITADLRSRQEMESVPLANIKQYQGLSADENLFDTIMVVENYPLDMRQMNTGENVPLKPQTYSTFAMTDFDLTVIIEIRDEIKINFAYDATIFTQNTIEQLAHYFHRITGKLITTPGEKISAVELLTEAEKHHIMVHYNETTAKYPHQKTIHQLFREQVEKKADSTAVTGIDTMGYTLTYRELNERTTQLAVQLMEKGVTPGSIVAIISDASFEIITGVLGILKAGAAYLPIDPTFPEERTKYILRDSNIKVLLTNVSPTQELPEACKKCETIDLKSGIQNPASGIRHPTSGIRHPATSLAYIIYTSGSTGKPKGTLIEHRAAVNLLWALQKAYPLTRRDTYLLKTSFIFDVSVTELFGWFYEGGRVAVLDREGARDPKEILKAIQREQATHINFVPSMFNMFVDSLNQVTPATPNTPAHPAVTKRDTANIKKLATLKYIFLAGEAVWPELVTRFRKLETGITIENLYGPTEATIYATGYPLAQWRRGNTVPIGKPVANLQIYIFSKKMQIQPVGVPGELAISGVGLARGYLNKPELTRESFTNFPGIVGATRDYPLRIYKSGDLARWLPGGNIEFLGRIDHQVKIRGYRIEIDEVENQLLSHPGIQSAVVITRKNAANENYLCGYFIPTQPPPGIPEIQEYLGKKLPGYMVPTYFVSMKEFPKLPNGKLDRKRLPKPRLYQPESETEDMAPRTEMEKKLAEVWLSIEGHEKISIDLTYFEMGGTSLSLMRFSNKLLETMQIDVPVVTLFRYTSIRSLAHYLDTLAKVDKPQSKTAPAKRQPPTAATAPGEDAAQTMDKTAAQAAAETIKFAPGERVDTAVIGMAGRFPGAANIHEYWKNLERGVESIRIFSDDELLEAGVEEHQLEKPNYIKAKGYLENAGYFDATFFEYSPGQAELLDPQTRIFLQCSWEALEDACISPQKTGEKIGLYAGSSINFQWFIKKFTTAATPAEQFEVFGLNSNFFAALVSYKLNLTGPGVTVNTACSTSLAALDLARREIVSGNCDVAIAGAVCLAMPRKTGYHYQEGMIMSQDGHCRAFDKKAKGTVGGEGAGVVVLKELQKAIADGNHIYAILKGTALNNDGTRKIGYTAPSIEGQAEVIQAAHRAAGIQPETVTYVEAHGTATTLGDPIEVEALKTAFNTPKKGYCALGSVKTNIGHLDTAAGMAGIIKTVLALKHRLIPPSLHYQEANPKIDFENSPFYVVTRPTIWHAEKHPRRAGVSSFGIGGTNGHVILEEAPPTPHTGETKQKKEARCRLLILSAKNETALQQAAENLKEYLERNQPRNLQDIAYTLQQGRTAFKYRRATTAATLEEAIEALNPENGKTLEGKPIDENSPVIFMFPGQGSQYVEMGQDLMKKEPVFRDAVEHCFDIMEKTVKSEINFRTILYPQNNTKEKEEPKNPDIDQTVVTQPLIFIFEYALAKQLMAWGIQPHAMIGHSIGEYAAAHLAGVLTLEDALKLVTARGAIMQEIPAGSMLSIPLPAEQLTPILPEGISLAAANSTAMSVVSGTREAIEAFEKAIKEDNPTGAKEPVNTRRLHTSHAFHSAMTDPVLETFQKTVAEVTINPPEIPYISNVTGKPITAADVTCPTYWTRHLRGTVRFAEGIRQLMAQREPLVFLEVGPGKTLSTFVRQHGSKKKGHQAINLVRHPKETAADDSYLLSKIGLLWINGKEINWEGMYDGNKPRYMPLPPYPFQRRQYGDDAGQFKPQAQQAAGTSAEAPLKKQELKEWFYTPVWKRKPLPWQEVQEKPAIANCLVFTRETPFQHRLLEQLEKEIPGLIRVYEGSAYYPPREGHTTYRIAPRNPEDYKTLFAHLEAKNHTPELVIHMWGITGREKCSAEAPESPCLRNYESALDTGFYSLLNIVKALTPRQQENGDRQGDRQNHRLRIEVITDNMQEVTGNEQLCPEKAPVLGPIKVIPQENLEVSCRSIDIENPSEGTQQQEKLIRRLLDEVHSAIPTGDIAFRGNYRWEKEYGTQPISPRENPKLKTQGSYMITGGLGNIGLILTQHLVKNHQANVILTNRSPFPQRNQWQEILEAVKSDDKISEKIRIISELEKTGAKILVIQANVANPMEMEQAVCEAEKHFGAIDGVFHCAGVVGENSYIPIREIENAQSHEQLQPKMDGLIVLNEI